MQIIYIIIGAVVILGVWIAMTYNSFVQLTVKVKEAWSGIDVQLKRRYDLIPNLVSTVKGYATHEEGVFEAVVKARNLAMSATTPVSKGETEMGLASALKSVFALSEAYPDLKANQNFLDLQNKLSETEETLQAARRFYNGNVRELNIKVDSFPSNIIANAMGFTAAEYFELDNEEAKNVVEVKF